MDLYDEFADPATLTGYGRQALEDDNENQFTLSRWLPNQLVDDLRYRVENGPTGILDAADYRAWGAEPTFGRREGIKSMEGSLPPLGRQMTLLEYDAIVLRKAEEKVRELLLRDSAKIANVMGRRMEVARAQAIVDARVDLAENGLVLNVVFGRDAAFEPVPVELHDDPDADVLDELLGWAEVWSDGNGGAPGALITSRRVVSAWLKNPQIISAIRPNSESTARVRRSDLDALLVDEGLPPIYIYEGRVTELKKVSGVWQRVTRRIIPDHKVIMAPTPGAAATEEGGQSGATLWGTTLESQLDTYGIEPGEEPGIVVGAFIERKTPVHVDTIGSAIALPVVIEPNHFLVSPVLAPAA